MLPLRGGLEPLCWEERLGELGLFTCGGEGCGESLEQLPVPWGPVGKMGKIFSAGLVAIKRGAMAFNSGRGDLDWI